MATGITGLKLSGDCSVDSAPDLVRVGVTPLPLSDCCGGAALRVVVHGKKRLTEDPLNPGQFHTSWPVLFLGVVGGQSIAVQVGAGYDVTSSTNYRISALMFTTNTFPGPLDGAGVYSSEIELAELESSTWTISFASKSDGTLHFEFRGGSFLPRVVNITNLRDFIFQDSAVSFGGMGLIILADVDQGLSLVTPTTEVVMGCGDLVGGTDITLAPV